MTSHAQAPPGAPPRPGGSAFLAGPASAADRTPAAARLLLALVAAAAFFLVLAASSSFGVGTTPDSLEYFAAAQSLAEGRGLQGVDGEPFVVWPPLYPLVLSAGPLAGIDVLSFARWLQALLAGAIVAAVGGFVLYRGGSRPLALLAAALTAAGKPLLSIESFAWSEPLFVLLVVVALAALARHLDGASPWALTGSAAATAALCLTRYAGAVLWPVALLAIIALGPGTRRARACAAAYFTLLAAGPPVAWLLRNLAVSGSLTGPRRAAVRTLAANLNGALTTINAWLLPRDVARTTEALPWLTAAVALGLAGGLGWVVWVSCRRGPGEPEEAGRRHCRDAALLAAFAAAYFSFIVATASLTVMDRVGNRYLAPLFVVLVVLAALALARLIARGPAESRPRRHRAALAGGLVVLVLAALQGQKAALYLARNGQGFTSATWRAQSAVHDAAGLPGQCVVWTSHPAVLRALAQRAAVPLPDAGIALSPPPGPADADGNSPTDAPRGLAPLELPAGQIAYLVWLGEDYPPRRGLPSLAALARHFDISTCFERPDGTVYRLGQRPTDEQARR